MGSEMCIRDRRSALRYFLEDEPALGEASGEARPAIARAPAPSPLPRGGVLIRAPHAYLGRMTTQKTRSSAPGGVESFAKGFFRGRMTR